MRPSDAVKPAGIGGDGRHLRPALIRPARGPERPGPVEDGEVHPGVALREGARLLDAGFETGRQPAADRRGPARGRRRAGARAGRRECRRGGLQGDGADEAAGAVRAAAHHQGIGGRAAILGTEPDRLGEAVRARREGDRDRPARIGSAPGAAQGQGFRQGGDDGVADGALRVGPPKRKRRRSDRR